MSRHPVPGLLIQRARTLAHSGGRRLLGIVGPPGAGKSSLAEGLVQELAPLACHVPMDGFHLANTELARLRLQERKGAPQTFDAGGYVALLERIAACDEEVVYAPEYLREIEEPVAGSIPVPSSVPLVVTEGNYLLLDQGPWARVRPLLDEVWFVDVEAETRRSLLIGRHIRFGKEPEAARAWALGTDERNADLVAATKHRADLVVPLALAALPRTADDTLHGPDSSAPDQASAGGWRSDDPDVRAKKVAEAGQQAARADLAARQ